MEETSSIKAHQSANAYVSKKNIILNNFLGGLAWGFGTVVGATVVVAILAWFFNFINLVPIIGNMAAEIVGIVNQKNPAP